MRWQCRIRMSRSQITLKPPGAWRDDDAFQSFITAANWPLNVREKSKTIKYINKTSTTKGGSCLHYPCRSSHNRDISASLCRCPDSCQFCFQENSNKEPLGASDTFPRWHFSYFPGIISVAATSAFSPWLQSSDLRFEIRGKCLISHRNE